MDKYLFSPPVAFIIIFLAALSLSYFFARTCAHPKKHTKDEGLPYACGEDNYDHSAQPDYSVFFPFAFFFTIAHVATMIMTTIPAQVLGVLPLALLYIGGAVIGLYILMRS